MLTIGIMQVNDLYYIHLNHKMQSCKWYINCSTRVLGWEFLTHCTPLIIIIHCSFYVQIVGSQVNVKDKLLFIGNNALEGGALYISAFGQIVLYRGAELFFTENVGRCVLFKTLTLQHL